MKVFVSYVLAAMLIVRQCVYGIEDEMQLKQLRGSPVLKVRFFCDICNNKLM